MRKIRAVLGSNDGENIIPDHMGTARDFYIFDLFEDGKSVLVEKRENTRLRRTRMKASMATSRS